MSSRLFAIALICFSNATFAATNEAHNVSLDSIAAGSLLLIGFVGLIFARRRTA